VFSRITIRLPLTRFRIGHSDNTVNVDFVVETCKVAELYFSRLSMTDRPSLTVSNVVITSQYDRGAYDFLFTTAPRRTRSMTYRPPSHPLYYARPPGFRIGAKPLRSRLSYPVPLITTISPLVRLSLHLLRCHHISPEPRRVSSNSYRRVATLGDTLALSQYLYGLLWLR
jgi:hypothetical protein